MAESPPAEIRTRRNGQTDGQGLFGDLNLLPLINELIPESLIDVIMYGFQHPELDLISGLRQNDGRMFPPENEAPFTGFCSFCRAIRERDAGAERCDRSCRAAVRLLRGKRRPEDEPFARPTPSLTRKTVDYLCHARNLEILVPVKLYLGKFKESRSVVVGGLWGGQFRLRPTDEISEVLEALARETAIPVETLRAKYEEGRDLVGKETIEHVERRILEVAEIISRQVTEAYGLQARRKADEAVSELASGLDDVLQASFEAEAGLLPQLKVAHILKPRIRRFVESHQLKGSYVFELRPSEDQQRVSAQPCFGWPSLPRDPISFPGSDAQWITNCTHANDPVVIPQEDVGRDKFLTRLFDVCGADVHADVVSVAGFSSRPAAKYVWVAIEDGKRAWYISPEGLQPGFDSVFSLVLPHVAACFGILDLLHMETDLLRREASKTEELEKTNRELQERDRQTHQLVLRMAHLVSRPILELRLGADHLISNPSSTSVRQRFGKCLFDLKRASANFQAYASLDSREVDRQEAITSFDIVGVLWRARDAVAPLGNFKRRPIALNIPKEFLGGKYVLGRRSALLEILVNILHNGIKYSFGGREVAVELRERDRGISVSFTNYGCGIAEDERDKIFEPEYRSEMAKQFEAEGAGMGLAIARSLAVRGGGDLQLLSCDPFDLLEIRPGTERKRYQTVFELWYPSP